MRTVTPNGRPGSGTDQLNGSRMAFTRRAGRGENTPPDFIILPGPTQSPYSVLLTGRESRLVAWRSPSIIAAHWNDRFSRCMEAAHMSEPLPLIDRLLEQVRHLE